MRRRPIFALLGLALAALAFSAPALAAPARPAGTVLFDMAHGQRFSPEGRNDLDLGFLGDAFRDGGFTVSELREPVTDQALKNVSVFVVSGPFIPFSAAEAKAVRSFVERGGNLAVMLHVAPPAATLLASFETLVSPGVLRETKNLIGTSGTDFSVKQFLPHPLFQDITEFQVHGGWPLLGGGKTFKTVAFSSDGGWVDMDQDGKRHPEAEPMHSYGIVVAGETGRGKVAIFGDDAIFQNKFVVAHGNKQLTRNLVAWFSPKAK